MNYIECRIEDELNTTRQLSSFDNIYRIRKRSKVRNWVVGIFAALLLVLFIPWTQNIRAVGAITTLRQEQRPQQLNTIIPGRVLKWHVKEGDYVQAGDTIMQLGEIKDDYLDTSLLTRTREQLLAKQNSVQGYQDKVGTAESQLQSLSQARTFKLAQIENKFRQQMMKIQSDSMEMLAALNDYQVATQQMRRQQNMFDSGLVSLTQLEQRKVSLQNALAKKTSAEIKFMNAKQELGILQLEMNGTMQDYNEKISKAAGDKFQSVAQVAGGQGEISKLQNQYTNYDQRRKLYFITAPQGGQIVRAKKAGIGEILKEGEMIVEIVPDHVQFAVEVFVRPVDLPLLDTGQTVRFMFDGFPAIVFSGWPEASYGTFSGRVTAIESSVSPNGKFRVLVAEDSTDKKWPTQLRIGAGAQAMALMKDVPIWYELWRNINGFPPDYYRQQAPKDDTQKTKS